MDPGVGGGLSLQVGPVEEPASQQGLPVLSPSPHTARGPEIRPDPRAPDRPAKSRGRFFQRRSCERGGRGVSGGVARHGYPTVDIFRSGHSAREYGGGGVGGGVLGLNPGTHVKYAAVDRKGPHPPPPQITNAQI